MKKVIFAAFAALLAVGCINCTENKIETPTISRIMVAEANRICTVELFYSDTNKFCDDRLDRQGSLAIFRTVMDYHNPSYNVDKAVDIWNHRATRSYRSNIKRYFQQALEDESLRAYFD